MTLFLLSLHNIFRWLVLVFGVLALVRAYAGWLGKKSWLPADNRVGLIFTIVLDIQFLLGLILYVFPGTFTMLAFSDPSSAMQNPVVRFFAVEHFSIMLIAIILAHVGRSASRRAVQALSKHRRAALWFTAAIILILAAIPWPFMENTGRPLLRFFGLF
jgi:hypothetical protein